MYFSDMDWTTVDKAYLDGKLTKLRENPEDSTVKRNSFKNLTALLSAAILLREIDAANFIWQYVDEYFDVATVFKSKFLGDFIIRSDRYYRLFCDFSKGAIMVAKEKHGTRYFDMSDPDSAAKSVFKLARERYEEGYYLTDDDNKTELQADLFKKPVETDHQMVGRHLVYAETPTKKYWAAYHLFKFMVQRSNYEYEEISLEYLEI